MVRSAPSMESQLSFMTRYLYELQSSPVFLFLGCMIIATAAEWIAGHVAGTDRPRQMVGLFQQKMEHGRLHLPPVFRTLGNP